VVETNGKAVAAPAAAAAIIVGEQAVVGHRDRE
jgi:hypothetical protein